MNAVFAWPRMMRRDLAQDYVGGETMLAEMEAKKLVTPAEQRNRLTLYDRYELDAACDAWRKQNAK